MDLQAQFSVGQLVHHKVLDYRGVVIDVDANFQSSDFWYELLAPHYPPRDMPWYRVLVDNSDYITYVAEQNLEIDSNSEPINNPAIHKFFTELKNGAYVNRRSNN